MTCEEQGTSIVLPSPEEGSRVPFMGHIDHSCSSRTFGFTESMPGSCGSLGASLVFKAGELDASDPRFRHP